MSSNFLSLLIYIIKYRKETLPYILLYELVARGSLKCFYVTQRIASCYTRPTREEKRLTVLMPTIKRAFLLRSLVIVSSLFSVTCSFKIYRVFQKKLISFCNLIIWSILIQMISKFNYMKKQLEILCLNAFPFSVYGIFILEKKNMKHRMLRCFYTTNFLENVQFPSAFKTEIYFFILHIDN